MRTQSVSAILALAVWLLISPGLLFAQQDSIPGVPLHQPQEETSVPHSLALDTVITVTKLPYHEAKSFPQYQRPRGPSTVARGGAPAHSAVRNPSFSLPIDNYDSCIHHRLQLQLTADLTTLQESKKGAWLKYLPSVSAGLAPSFRRGADGSFSSGLSPTLSIGVNSSLIYQSHRDKQQRKAATEAIIKQNQLREATEIAQLHRLQRRLQTEIDKLNLQNGVSDIDRQLFTGRLSKMSRKPLSEGIWPILKIDFRFRSSVSRRGLKAKREGAFKWKIAKPVLSASSAECFAFDLRLSFNATDSSTGVTKSSKIDFRLMSLLFVTIFIDGR
jgi:hypothetical protein